MARTKLTLTETFQASDEETRQKKLQECVDRYLRAALSEAAHCSR